MSLSIKGVIFEILGTLVDSSFALTSSWKDALDEVGVRSSFEEIQSLIGMGYEELVPKLAGVEKNSARGQEIIKRHDEIFKAKYLSQLKELPGGKELIGKLKSLGLQIAVITSATQDELDTLLQSLELTELVDVKNFRIEESDETFQSLDRVEETLDDLGLEPSEVIYLSNSPYGLEAANHFGIKSIAFQSAIWKDEELKGAAAIYRNPADLLRQFESSPLASASKVA